MDILGDIMDEEFAGRRNYFVDEDFVEKNDKVTEENLDQEGECVSEKPRIARLVAVPELVESLDYAHRRVSDSLIALKDS